MAKTHNDAESFTEDQAEVKTCSNNFDGAAIMKFKASIDHEFSLIHKVYTARITRIY